MRVRVRFGAGLAAVAGRARVTVELSESATIAELFDRLRETDPSLSLGLHGVLAVVGGTQVDHSHRLSGDDEVALLMPAAGG